MLHLEVLLKLLWNEYFLVPKLYFFLQWKEQGLWVTLEEHSKQKWLENG